MNNTKLRKKSHKNGHRLEDFGSTNVETLTVQPKADDPSYMEQLLKGLSPRWRNWWIRTWYTVVMIAAFAFIVYIGTLGFLIGVAICQVQCFHEIITIGYQVYKSYDLRWFRTLSWYFLFCANYFFYGESLAGYFGALIQKEDYLLFLIRYHRMISFFLYLCGLMLFVLSLVKNHYQLQFFMFGWTHVTLLIIVTQSNLAKQNMLEGTVWLILPHSMVICNDIMAYICGFFFGKTPLIKLSPKKTWEGFIGGGICTVVFGWFFSAYLSQFSNLTCPAVATSHFAFSVDCNPAYIFEQHSYRVPQILQTLGVKQTSVSLYPFQLHSLLISIFASLIAPFGGFFASGFKRAFQIKDFGDSIPGHGGFMDRLDCQYLMATFINVYLYTFIKLPSPQAVLPLIFTMSSKDQLQLYNDLKSHLTEKGSI